MSRKFSLVGSGQCSSSVDTTLNWKLCIICQEEKDEPLTCPMNSKRKDLGSGYASLSENLIEFDELGKLPFSLRRLDEGQGIEQCMVDNAAQYHHSCRLKYNNTKLQRATKRVMCANSEDRCSTECKRRKLRSTAPDSVKKDVCFFVSKVHGLTIVFTRWPHLRSINM